MALRALWEIKKEGSGKERELHVKWFQFLFSREAESEKEKKQTLEPEEQGVEGEGCWIAVCWAISSWQGKGGTIIL